MTSTVFFISMTIMAIFIAFEPTFANASSINLKNQATNLRLDSNAEGHVYTLSPNGNKWQVWTIVNTHNNCVKLVNSATGRCLDSNHNGNVYALGCNGGNFQNWRFQNLRLVNCETNRCLDSNFAGNAYTLNCNGGQWQNWINA